MKNLKQNARNKGVEIYSVWSSEIRQGYKPSSIKEFVCKSKLPREAIISVLIPFFHALGYTGTVRVEGGLYDFYSIKLSKRIGDKYYGKTKNNRCK